MLSQRSEFLFGRSFKRVLIYFVCYILFVLGSYYLIHYSAKAERVKAVEEAKRPVKIKPQALAKIGAPMTLVAEKEISEHIIDSPGGRFPYGQCTWYVATKRNVPWNGNAGTWVQAAKKYGRLTGMAPKTGAIMVSAESYWGHAAYVEEVNGNAFTISEMNKVGWGRVSTRTLRMGEIPILGFIY